MKDIPEHYDKFGRIINEGSRVLVASSFGSLRLLTVVKLCPVQVKVGASKSGSELHYPHSLVVWNG